MGSLKVRGLPVKARLRFRDSWEVTVTEDGPSATLTVFRSKKGGFFTRDIWAIRGKFFELDSAEDARALFRELGPLHGDKDLQEFSSDESEKVDIKLSTVHQYQNWFYQFMREESPGWCSGKSFDMQTNDGAEGFVRELALHKELPQFTLLMGHVVIKGKKEPSPFLNLEAVDVFSAVYASIYIDKMRGLSGKVCERESCTKTFINSDPRKRFCGDSCSAYVRVTENRANKKGKADVKA